MKRYQLHLLLALLTAATSHAQVNVPKYQFGINAGFGVYQGDLTPNRLGSFNTQRFALGLHASRLLSPAVSIRAHFLRTGLRGDDALYSSPEYRQQRNFNFRTPVTEFTGQLLWNPMGTNYADKGWAPYVFAGAGLSFLHIRRDWSGLNAAYFDESSNVFSGLAIDTAHSTARVIPVIPVGAGVNYFLNPRIGLNAEASYRLGYTDYLDGFSEAANPARKDHYLNYSVGIFFRTGKKNMLKCPKMRY